MVSYPLSNILFLDIETVSQYKRYEEVPQSWKDLWSKKATSLLRTREEETTESIYNRAGIYAEFGKIICISCGVINGSDNNRRLTLKSFSGHNEALLLQAFAEMLRKWTPGDTKYLCAHNGREFDFPYLCRRFLINRLPLPSLLQMAGKKPWEINHIDTMELWKFGDFKNYTSLNLLAHALDIPTPKDDIDGSMVAEVYWQQQDLDRIVTYCQKDVVTIAQVYLRMAGLPLITPDHIDIKS